MSQETKTTFYDKVLSLKFNDLKRMYTQLWLGEWEFAKERDGIKLYTKIDEQTGIKMVRGEGIVNAPAQKIIETALKIDENTKWDDTVEEGKLIENLHGYHVVYNLLKRVGFLAKREALTVFRSFHEPDGTIYAVGTSIDHPEVPATEKYVRTHITMAGWVLKPLEENPDRTYVTYILSADPQGFIPKHIVNWVIEEQGMSIRKLGNYVERKLMGQIGQPYFMS